MPIRPLSKLEKMFLDAIAKPQYDCIPFYDREDQKIVYVGNVSDDFEMALAQKDELLMAIIEDDNDRYVFFPDVSKITEMTNFANRHENPIIRQILKDALASSQPMDSFDSVLLDLGIREEWVEYLCGVWIDTLSDWRRKNAI